MPELREGEFYGTVFKLLSSVKIYIHFLSMVGRIAPKLFHLGQTFHASFHKLSTIVCWNFGPLLLTELV